MDVKTLKLYAVEGAHSFLQSCCDGRDFAFVVFGGSHAYGTNVESSDIDLRGIVTRTPEEILLGIDKEVFADTNSDTSVYTLDKFIKLACQCNPNIIEMLGCRPDTYFYKTEIGDILLENRKLFLSQRCIHTFGGYAISQLRRLENISARYVEQEKREKHILESIENASVTFKQNYPDIKDGRINLYIDDSNSEDLDKEIFMDVNLTHYPLRDYCNMWNEMKSIVSSYNNLGKRNTRAKEHHKIGKHSMHLIRLYMMCIDILEEQEINTYRSKEHNLLMSIRNGKFLDENEQVRPEFFDLIDKYQKRLEEAKKNTNLPKEPDMEKINSLLVDINKRIVAQSIK